MDDRMKTFMVLALTLFLANTALPGQEAPKESFNLKLSHDFKVGEKNFTKVHVVDRSNMIRTKNGVPDGEQANYIEVEAEYLEEITKVSQKKKAYEANVVFSRIVGRNDPKVSLTPLAVQGAGVRVVFFPELKFVRNDGALISPPEDKALRMLFSSADDNRARDDEVFGKTSPVRVGDSWEPDKKRMAEDLTRTPVVVSPDQIVGSVKLLEKKLVNGADCLVVQANFDFNSKLDNPKFQNGTSKSSVRLTFEAPINADLPRCSGQMQMSMVMEGDSPPSAGEPSHVTLKSERVKNVLEYKPAQ